MKRLLSLIASSPETVSTSAAGSKEASEGSVCSRKSSGSPNCRRRRCRNSCGAMQTYSVVESRRTEWTIPALASFSSVAYTFDEGSPADLLSSLPF